MVQGTLTCYYIIPIPSIYYLKNQTNPTLKSPSTMCEVSGSSTVCPPLKYHPHCPPPTRPDLCNPWPVRRDGISRAFPMLVSLRAWVWKVELEGTHEEAFLTLSDCTPETVILETLLLRQKGFVGCVCVCFVFVFKCWQCLNPCRMSL